MLGTTKKQTNPNPAAAPAPTKEPEKVDGTTYDLCKKVKQEDGTDKLKRIGAVFIRANGNGGVAWIADDDGTKYELPIFARSKRAQGPKPAAAAA